MACSSGCPTPGEHSSYGECLRSKSMQVQDVTAHKYNQGLQRQVKEYVDARKEGMQPASIYKRDVDYARKATKVLGTPYRADKD